MNAPQDFRAMTADSIGKDLLSALVTEVKLLPDTWPKLSQKRHPDNVNQTWSGRGRKPAWVVEWLENGGSMDDLLSDEE